MLASDASDEILDSGPVSIPELNANDEKSILFRPRFILGSARSGSGYSIGYHDAPGGWNPGSAPIHLGNEVELLILEVYGNEIENVLSKVEVL